MILVDFSTSIYLCLTNTLSAKLFFLTEFRLHLSLIKVLAIGIWYLWSLICLCKRYTFFLCLYNRIYIYYRKALSG